MTGPTPSTDPGNPRNQQSSGWPLRPVLSLLLLGCLLISAAILVAAYRGESTVGTALARLIGLPPRAHPDPTPLNLLAFKQDRDAGQWQAIDLSAANPVVEETTQAIQRDNLPAARYTIRIDTSRRTGFWAPTSTKLEFTVKRTAHPGAADLSPTDQADALAAIADQLQTRAAWHALAQPIQESALQQPDFAGQVSRKNKRGYAQNIATALVAMLLVFSLSRRPGAIHETYDACVSIGRKLGGAAVLALAWTAFPAFLGIMLLYFLKPIAAFLRTDPALGWFAYVAVFIVSAGIGFLPTYGQSFLGGWVFGFARGFPGAMLGFVGGSVIGYFIAQRVSKDRVVAMLESNAKARKVRNALIGKSFWRTCGIVTLIRVPPNSPFALTNLVLASSGVSLLPYIVGTALGMAPRTAIAVWLAAVAARTGAEDIGDFVENQPWWALPLGLLVFVVVLAILGWIANRALHEVTKDIPDAPDIDAAAD